jgi:hypothetical protein
MRRSTVNHTILLLVCSIGMIGCSTADDGVDVTAAETPSAAVSPSTDETNAPTPTGSSVDPDQSTDEPREQAEDQDDDEQQIDKQDDEDGISVEQAESIGALTGDYDMLLTGPHSVAELEDGCLQVTYRAENVGKLADRYRFETDQGDVEPTRIEVEAGEAEPVTVTICDLDQPEFVLDVLAADRGDELLDQVRSP